MVTSAPPWPSIASMSTSAMSKMRRLRCLPAKLHVTPDQIPAAVDEALGETIDRYDRVFVGYADCGTAGALDRVLERHGAERLPGAHCYGFFAGNDAFDAMHEEEPATFYLTDFLARHFEALVVRGLKLDLYPELLPQMFGAVRTQPLRQLAFRSNQQCFMCELRRRRA